MKGLFRRVMITQFLTAFADNAILFTAITIILQKNQVAPWYVPTLQASFLVAFVLLAPWVGPFADARPKPRVLMLANLVKAAGVVLLWFSVSPLLAYALVGLGAAIYSPAKYGILPEITPAQDLVRANGWIEGSTILAILSGTLVGAWVSEWSIHGALVMILSLYLVSAVVAMSIRHTFVKGRSTEAALSYFKAMSQQLLATPRARFATLGVSLFWAAATVLRVLLVAWAPMVLMLTKSSDIATLTLFTAIGIAVGSLLASRLIPLHGLSRARFAGYATGFAIILLGLVDQAGAARGVLFLIGFAGGIFVVPINAALQEIGHQTIGSGKAVGIQNFFENLTMLTASGLFALAARAGANPIVSLQVLGLLVVISTLIISRRLPPVGER
ncbi:MAG: lysophospholipid transporter LplT [Gammaproteobacteria bacterium]|nr:MAG: lysophospholipid transporter LplT [Gammaproteobacteria bacterium]